VTRQRRQARCALGVLLLHGLLLASSEAAAQGKFHRNEKFGYVVFYPERWLPSGNVYANAFELRNYDSKSPGAVAERNRASLIVVDTLNESPEVTSRFLDGLATEPPFCIVRLSIGGRRAVRVARRMPAQQLGPGAAGAPPSGQATAGPRFFFAIDAHIANGKHLISIEARAPVEADPEVLQDVMWIQENVKFQTPQELRQGGGVP